MAQSIYDFEVKDLTGKPVKLEQYKGKVLLVVNIASKCGLTPQLKGLEKIYKQYKEKGFEILAFPSNDFMQEPKEGADIAEFCSINYGVDFKVFEKGKVKGDNAQPVYQYLGGNTKRFGLFNNYPVWNFQKYLVDKNGRVVDWFAPWKKPEDAKITAEIEKCLAQ